MTTLGQSIGSNTAAAPVAASDLIAREGGPGSCVQPFHPRMDVDGGYNSRGFFSGDDFSQLKLKLVGLAAAVFIVAFAASFYFTWRRAKRQGVSLWGPVSKRLFWNMSLPLIAGAGFILAMLRYDDWRYVSSASLIFYGLALINASKYTLTDIRYLGYCEIILGLVNMFYIGSGLYFWAAGFGVLHIVYGIIMWNKYERNGQV